jgi:hypothetical protein
MRHIARENIAAVAQLLVSARDLFAKICPD